MKKSTIYVFTLLIFLIIFGRQLRAQIPAQFHRLPQKSVQYQAKQAAHFQKLKEKAVKEGPSAQPRTKPTDEVLPQTARFAAQFEENQAIAMTWAYDIQYDSTFTFVVSAEVWGDDTYGTISCDLADAIQGSAVVLIRVWDYADTVTIKQIMQDRGTPLYNHAFYKNTVDSWWDRDSGPVCFYYSDQDSIGILDMDYYTYEAVKFEDGTFLDDYNEINAFNRINDDSIPIRIGEKLGYPVFRTSLNNEGGNLIFDGLGTTWTSTRTRELNIGSTYAFAFDPITFEVSFDSSIVLYPNYPVLDDAGYEQLYQNAYQSKTFIEPITLDCEGGTGHLDIFIKLFDENRLGIMDYSHAPGHSDFEDWNTNNTAFKTLTDGNGQPLDIRTLPMPLSDGDVPQSECEIDQRTYINGIFVNKSFIMPVQSNPKTGLKPSDVEAVAAFQKALPGYKIIPVDAAIMFGLGGALHCITHEIPAENPIFIQHAAIRGTQPLQNAYNLTAEIKNKSGIADAKTYFRKAGQTAWQPLPMTASAGNKFTASMTGAGFAKLDTIEYFIEAKSVNGKTISKPFTAREGGFYRFVIAGSVATDDDLAAQSVQIFPNPSAGLFQVNGLESDGGVVEITVFSTLGQVVLAKKMTANNPIFDLTNQPPGIYFAKVRSNGVQKTFRLVKA
jgi:agmatine/peptidylarginine deiminase